MNALFPREASNSYRGSRIAKWALVPVIVFTVVRSLLHIFLRDGGAQSIATIPLDSYSFAAQAAVIQIFSLWGLSQLITGLLQALIFFRYNNLIPLVYASLVLEYSGRLILAKAKPIVLNGVAPGGLANYFLIPLFILLFVLSLRRRDQSAAEPQDQKVDQP